MLGFSRSPFFVSCYVISFTATCDNNFCITKLERGTDFFSIRNQLFYQVVLSCLAIGIVVGQVSVSVSSLCLLLLDNKICGEWTVKSLRCLIFFTYIYVKYLYGFVSINYEWLFGHNEAQNDVHCKAGTFCDFIV